MSSVQPILFEGYTAQEILNLPKGVLEGFLFTGTPLTIRVGSAIILSAFRLQDALLEVELAQIDGGGEGVLIALWNLVTEVSHQHQIARVHWIVHAVYCRQPNRKLQRVLLRRGFVVKDIVGIGQAYFYEQCVTEG